MRLNQVVHSLPFWASIVLAAPLDSNKGNLIELQPGQAAPKRYLRPAVHWNITTSGHEHVRASRKQTLYYAEGDAHPDVEHHFGATTNNYTVPAMNVDYADSVNIDDAKDTVTVDFSDNIAYDQAYGSWNGQPKLLLLTYADICDAHKEHDYCYVLVTNIAFDNVTTKATGHAETVNVRDYLYSTSFEWGVYTPVGKAPTGSLERRGTGTANATNACNARDPNNGLPVATLGANFDNRLDACRGYEKLSASPFGAYVKSVGGDQEAHGKLTVDTSKDLHGTLEFLHLKKAKAIAEAAVAAKNAKNGKSRRSVGLAKRGWLSWIPAKIPGVNSPISKDFQKQIPYSLPSNRGSDDSPWGKAKLLKKWTGQKTSTGTKGLGSGSVSADGSISVYCVDCGAAGSVDIYGKGSWSVDSGLSEGYVQSTVNVNIGLSIGLDIQAQLQAQANQNIATYGIPGLSFGVITIGPFFSLGAEFLLYANAEGRLLAGGRFLISNARSTLDFVNPDRSTSSGWTPQFEPVFEAFGQVTVGAELALPLSLAIGIDIAQGRFVKSVAVVERPALEAKAEFAASADTNGARIVKTDGCAGIATQVIFKNDLFADIVGRKFNMMATYVKQLAKGCIPIGKQSSAFVAGNAAFTVPTIAASNSITSSVFRGYNTTSESGTEYTELVDATSKFFLATCPDGNIYMRPRAEEKTISKLTCSRIFESSHNSLIGDGTSRLFHYYTDSMSALGVSRLRVHRDDNIPKGSEYVNFYAYSNNTGRLVPDADINHDTKKTKAYYLAQDRNKQTFYPALCSYEDAGANPAKVFLVKDPVKGLSTLMSQAVQHSVTGGKVNGCYLLPFTQPLAEKGAAWNNQWNVNQGNEGATEGAKLDAVRDF